MNKAKDKAGRRASRREYIITAVRTGFAVFLGLFFSGSLFKASGKNLVWQINPEKCVQCGRCATSCVLTPSAVKCVHEYAICGYCNLCFAYFRPGITRITDEAYNQVCPTYALRRKFVEDQFFEYSIDEIHCIGCGKCVKGCGLFGNGSLYLQVRHDRCLNCNDCSIARVCAGRAYERVPAITAYIKKA